MPSRIQKRQFAWLWVAFAILAAVAALAYRSIDSAVDTLGTLEHTTHVLQQIGEVSGAYARAVTARRAFIVAGDESQLSDLPDLDARLSVALAAVRDLVVNNPAQRDRLESLALLLHQRTESLDASVRLRRLEGAAVETADGIVLGARIRAVREAMEGEENRLLGERDARTRRDLAMTKVAEILGTFASVAILLLAFGRLGQEILRRGKSEQALRTSQNFLDSIVENIPNMLFVKGAVELRFERINRAGEALIGIEREKLVGKNDYDFFPREQAQFFEKRDRETLAGRVVVDIPEEPIQTEAGERWLHTMKVPVLDERGTPKYLLGISEDITERRQAAATLKAAKDATEAANQELEAFSYSVAHDLRAPLRAIDGFSQAIEEDCADTLSGEGKAHLKRVRLSAQRMAQLIDDLLGLSRVTRGDMARETVDLTRLAQQSVSRLQESHPGREIDLVVDEGLVTEGDPRLLGTALDNLLGNAWKFTGKCENARIEVGKKVEDGRPVFFVRDNGAGFEQAYAHKLFGAFQRLHGASEFEGTGIGLATVQRIVRRHGGRVWAEGAVGRGATFYFTL